MTGTPQPGSPEANLERWKPPVPPSVAAQAAQAERLIAQTNGSSPRASYRRSLERHRRASRRLPRSPQPPAGDPVDTWEQRARSAQGRFEAAQATLQAQSERLENMEREMALLRASGASREPPPSVAAQQRLITEEEEKDYGKDLLDVVGRRTREVVAPEFETLQQRLERLEGRVNGVGQVIQQDQTRTVWQTLSENIPNWNEINHHPIFHSWLAQPDRYTGKPKKDLLSDAFGSSCTKR